MVEGTSYMFVTGPDVIRTVTHEEVTMEDLGGAHTHNAKSGVAHFAAADDRACLALIRDLLSFLPSNNLDDPPRVNTTDAPDREDPTLDTIVPASPTQPQRHADLIHTIADEAISSKCISTTRRTSSSASRGSTGSRSASSPISRRCWQGRSTSTRRSRARGS
jgi:acetyl-CoA carboxylase carboxyltransferase component